MADLTLKDRCYLKRLEEPFLYDAADDELYRLDEEAFERVGALVDERVRDDEAATLLAENGLAQHRPRRDRAGAPGRSAAPSLRYLEVQITARCDKACAHCYQGPPGTRDMHPGELTAVLDQFVTMQGLKVMLSGGEPRCHPRFRELADALAAYPFRRVLITHGENIGDAEAAWLGRCFDLVQVSLDGMETGHDRIRGRGAFPRVMEGLQALRRAGVPLAVGTMVHGGNLDEFDAMAGLLEELGAREWAIDVPCPAGRWDVMELADRHRLREMSARLRYAFGGGFHGGSGRLACGSHLMTLFPDGRGAKCGFYEPRPSPTALEDLAALWAGMEHIRHEQLDCDCDQLEFCAGGCRYRAEVLEGHPLAVDPVQCFARGIK